MKKFIASVALLLTLLVSFFITAPGISAQTMPSAIVAGVVFTPDYSELTGADVTVYCLHGGSYAIQSTTTGSTAPNEGFYMVEFYDGSCAVGDHVWVTAGKESLNGIGDGTVVQDGAKGMANVNVYTANQAPQFPPAPPEVPSAPEFGLLTGAGALIASAGSFLFLRKK